jgi:hypothetical protein
MMHFVFSLLRIKGRYMFRELLSHPQETQQMALVFRSNPGGAK